MSKDQKPLAVPVREDFSNSMWGLCPAVVRDLNAAGMDPFRYAEQTKPYLSDLLPPPDTNEHDGI